MSDDEIDQASPADSRRMDAEQFGFSALVGRARLGDPIALDELLMILRPVVRGLAQRLLVQENLTELAGARFDASDVTQNTLVGVSLEIGHFLGSTEVEFLSWVKTILRHDVVDCIRQQVNGKGRSVRREAHGADSNFTDGLQEHFREHEPTASAQAMQQESQSRIKQAVNMLESPDREIMRLAFFEDLSHAEIAERLGLRVKSVSKRITRAKKKLRVHLERER